MMSNGPTLQPGAAQRLSGMLILLLIWTTASDANAGPSRNLLDPDRQHVGATSGHTYTGARQAAMRSTLVTQTTRKQLRMLKSIAPQPFQACDVLCHNTQHQALTAALASTHPGFSSMTATTSDHCQWPGVSCAVGPQGAQGGVQSLRLAASGMAGQLATVIAALAPISASLQLLDLSSNPMLSGSIPDAISSLTSLQSLLLSDMQISGTIPAGLAALQQLQELDISDNKLTGTVPQLLWVERLTNLEVIDLSMNSLTGPAPTHLLNQINMHYFAMNDNRLNGTLDSRLENGTMAAFPPECIVDHLDLSANQFTGTIPPALARLGVHHLNLAHNQLTGTLPKELAQGKLWNLILSDNGLTGTIPPGIPNKLMQVIDLSNNQLTGTLPPIVGLPRDLRAIALANNSMTGSLPEVFGQLQFLEIVDMRETLMQSSAPWDAAASELLPSWATYGGGVKVSDTIICPGLHPSAPLNETDLLEVLLPPTYYRYEGCTCLESDMRPVYTYGHPALPLQPSTKSGAKRPSQGPPDGPNPPVGQIVVGMMCVPRQAHPGTQVFPPWAIALTAVLCTGLVVAGLIMTQRRVSKAFVRAAEKVAKRRAPGLPAKGKTGTNVQVTLVLTDVEGSTELWEWNSEVMSSALDMHDRILRQYMEIFFGYEVQTEGDAFLVAFHDPKDATMWALAVQLALNGAAWHPFLLTHPKAAAITTQRGPPQGPASEVVVSSVGRQQTIYTSHSQASRLSMVQDMLASGLERVASVSSGFARSHQPSLLLEQSNLICGLRIRVGIATGVIDRVKEHPVTKRVEYQGGMLSRLESLSNLIAGGQVLVDDQTFASISAHLSSLSSDVLTVLIKMSSPILQPGVSMKADVNQVLPMVTSSQHGGPSSRLNTATTNGASRFGQEVPSSKLALARPSTSIPASGLTSSFADTQGQPQTPDATVFSTPAIQIPAVRHTRSMLGGVAGSEQAGSPYWKPMSDWQNGLNSEQEMPLIVQGNESLSSHGSDGKPDPDNTRVSSPDLRMSMSEENCTIEAKPEQVTRQGNETSSSGEGEVVTLTSQEVQVMFQDGMELEVQRRTHSHTSNGTVQRSTKSSMKSFREPQSEQLHKIALPETRSSTSTNKLRRMSACAASHRPSTVAEVAFIPGQGSSPGAASSTGPLALRLSRKPMQSKRSRRSSVTFSLNSHKSSYHKSSSVFAEHHGIGRGSLMVHMGVFELVPFKVYQDVFQVLVPGLEDRARLLRLDSFKHRQVTPGYLEAPCALLAPLSQEIQYDMHYPHTTLVFCALDQYRAMCAADALLAAEIMDGYQHTIRRSLLACTGYECQESEGNFMIAFSDPAPALEWCCMVQEVMMEVPWSAVQLALPHSITKLTDADGASHFSGPGVKMGLYQGRPTKVVPHMTTGRADYFGLFVNRAARCCHATAKGGQVVASAELVAQVLVPWVPPNLLATLLPATSVHTDVMADVPDDSVPERLQPGGEASSVKQPQTSTDDSQLVEIHVTIDNSQVQPSLWEMPCDLLTQTSCSPSADSLRSAHSVAIKGLGTVGHSAKGVKPAIKHANFVADQSTMSLSSPFSTSKSTEIAHLAAEAVAAGTTGASPGAGVRSSAHLALQSPEPVPAYPSSPPRHAATRLLVTAIKQTQAQQPSSAPTDVPSSTTIRWKLSNNPDDHERAKKDVAAASMLIMADHDHLPVDRATDGPAKRRIEVSRSLSRRSHGSSHHHGGQSSRLLTVLGSKGAGFHDRQAVSTGSGRSSQHHIKVHSDTEVVRSSTFQRNTLGFSGLLKSVSRHLDSRVTAMSSKQQQVTRAPGCFADSVSQRTGRNRWLWMGEMVIEDLGRYRYKGVQGVHRMVSVSTSKTAGRVFDDKDTGKGHRVAPGKGKIIKIVFDCDPSTPRDMTESPGPWPITQEHQIVL